MRLPRMTTRRWMVAVAAIGLLMGAGISGHRLSRQRDYYLWLAMNYGDHETYYLMQQQKMTRALHEGGWLATPLETSRMAVRLPRMAHFYAKLRRKYEFAARYPWLPIEPDPPEPQ